MFRQSVLAAALCGAATLALAPGASAQAPVIVKSPPPLAAPQDSGLTLSEDEAAEAAEFIAGNVIFILYHEFGHALIDEFGLPVLAREEAAVDALATILMLPEAPDEVLDGLLVAAADGWFLSADATGGEQAAYWGEHGLDQQRAYQIVCLMVGSDPEGFAELARNTELPPERAAACPEEYARTRESWMAVLAPHVRPDGAPPGRTIPVTWKPAAESDADVAAMLKESGILEAVAADMAASFAWKSDVKIEAASCGEPNAFWNFGTRTVTLCHEITAYYRDLILADIAAR